MRKLPVLIVALLAAMGACALMVSMGSGSSHREAPLTSIDPTADDTDLYAYTADDAEDSLTVVANWIPFEDPAGGRTSTASTRRRPTTSTSTTRATGTTTSATSAVPDADRQPELVPLRAARRGSITDPKLNVKQFYTLKREAYSEGQAVDTRTLLTNAPVAPNNVGPKTFPDYDAVAAQAIKGIPGGGKSFSGQVDDPFFVDLGATFDAINLRIGPATRAAARTTWPATTCTRSSSRSPRRT